MGNQQPTGRRSAGRRLADSADGTSAVVDRRDSSDWLESVSSEPSEVAHAPPSLDAWSIIRCACFWGRWAALLVAYVDLWAAAASAFADYGAFALFTGWSIVIDDVWLALRGA